jgi:hypothetical protein
MNDPERPLNGGGLLIQRVLVNRLGPRGAEAQK